MAASVGGQRASKVLDIINTIEHDIFYYCHFSPVIQLKYIYVHKRFWAYRVKPNLENQTERVWPLKSFFLVSLLSRNCGVVDCYIGIEGQPLADS